MTGKPDTTFSLRRTRYPEHPGAKIDVKVPNPFVSRLSLLSADEKAIRGGCIRRVDIATAFFFKEEYNGLAE